MRLKGGSQKTEKMGQFYTYGFLGSLTAPVNSSGERRFANEHSIFAAIERKLITVLG
jgi:hypothetical protein